VNELHFDKRKCTTLARLRGLCTYRWVGLVLGSALRENGSILNLIDIENLGSVFSYFAVLGAVFGFYSAFLARGNVSTPTLLSRNLRITEWF